MADRLNTEPLRELVKSNFTVAFVGHESSHLSNGYSCLFNVIGKFYKLTNEDDMEYVLPNVLLPLLADRFSLLRDDGTMRDFYASHPQFAVDVTSALLAMGQRAGFPSIAGGGKNK